MSHWIVEAHKSPHGFAFRIDSKGRIVRRDRTGHTTRERLKDSGIFEDAFASEADGFIDWEPLK